MSTPSQRAITAAEKRYPDDGKMNTPDGPQTFPSPRVLCQRGAYATCYDELSERATQLEGERDSLRAFIEKVIRVRCWEYDEWDGGSTQDAAEELGILVRRDHPMPCEVEDCPCEGEDMDHLYYFAWADEAQHQPTGT